jgi:hypothetical protein
MLEVQPFPASVSSQRTITAKKTSAQGRQTRLENTGGALQTNGIETPFLASIRVKELCYLINKALLPQKKSSMLDYISFKKTNLFYKVEF